MWKKKWAHCPEPRLRARLRADAAKRFAGFAFVVYAVAVLAGCGGPGLPAPRPLCGDSPVGPGLQPQGQMQEKRRCQPRGDPREGGAASLPAAVSWTLAVPLSLSRVCRVGPNVRLVPPQTCGLRSRTRRDPPIQTSLVWLLFPNPALGLQLRAAGHAAGSLSLARRPQVTRLPTLRSQS